MSKRTIDASGQDEPAPRSGKVYISGPMTGIPDYNFPAFNAAAERFRAAGVDVVNPAEINVPGTGTWADYMRADIKQLCDCDGIHMLAGWTSSKGATAEWLIANVLGMSVHFESPDQRRADRLEAALRSILMWARTTQDQIFAIAALEVIARKCEEALQ